MLPDTCWDVNEIQGHQMLFPIWKHQLSVVLPDCVVQEVTNTLDHLKNHPPKTAHFNWIFDKALLSMEGSIGGAVFACQGILCIGKAGAGDSRWVCEGWCIYQRRPSPYQQEKRTGLGKRKRGDRFIFLIFSVFLAPEIPPVFQFSFLSHPHIVNGRSTVPFFSYSFGTIPYLLAYPMAGTRESDITNGWGRHRYDG